MTDTDLLIQNLRRENDVLRAELDWKQKEIELARRHEMQWISVKDRLPGDISRCLVCRYDFVTDTSFIDILWYEAGTWWNRLFTGDFAVTHWMPLPDAPKEANDGKSAY